MKKSNKNKKILKGRWNNIEINIKNKIIAEYDKIKDWEIDPKGYFLIKVDKKSNLIRIYYCKIPKKNKSSNHKALIEVQGTTAIEIVNTLISNKLISTLQHAADMGIELNKAELALRHGYKYIQDKDLDIN